MACIRIERATNGFTVAMTDPKIEAANNNAEIKRNGKWKNPTKEYVFETWAATIAFVTKNGEKALPADDYDSTFDLAASAGDNGD